MISSLQPARLDLLPGHLNYIGIPKMCTAEFPKKTEFVFLYIRARTVSSSGILGIPPDCVVEMLAAVQAN